MPDDALQAIGCHAHDPAAGLHRDRSVAQRLLRFRKALLQLHHFSKNFAQIQRAVHVLGGLMVA